MGFRKIERSKSFGAPPKSLGAVLRPLNEVEEGCVVNVQYILEDILQISAGLLRKMQCAYGTVLRCHKKKAYAKELYARAYRKPWEYLKQLS